MVTKTLLGNPSAPTSTLLSREVRLREEALALAVTGWKGVGTVSSSPLWL